MRKIISFWNKKELQAYVYNHNQKYPCSDAGMAAIIERFINTNEFQIGHVSEELKIGFDIVRSIARNTKIGSETVELIHDFIKHFEDVIRTYDRQSSQTYYHKLTQACIQSIELVEAKLKIENEINIKH